MIMILNPIMMIVMNFYHDWFWWEGYITFQNSSLDNDTMTKVLLWSRAEYFISDTYHNGKIDVWYLNLKAYHTKQYQVSQHDSSHLVNTILFTARFLKLYTSEQIFLKNIDKKRWNDTQAEALSWTRADCSIFEGEDANGPMLFRCYSN